MRQAQAQTILKLRVLLMIAAAGRSQCQLREWQQLYLKVHIQEIPLDIIIIVVVHSSLVMIQTPRIQKTYRYTF